MSLVLADRVQQTGTANTTVSFTLSGAVTGFQSFSVIGNGNTTYYSATDSTGNWEVGIGTYSTSGPTLTRTTILSSSNAGSAVTFSGTVNVFVTYPSEEAVVLGGTPTFSTVTTNASTTAASNVGPLNYGTLNFSDTGIVQSAQTSVNSYFQNVIQNTSNGTQASAEFIAYNDQGTATTNYATVGINSSGYSGTGSINAPGYGYFLTASTDLVLGTIGANGIHFTTNSSATDALAISSAGAVSLPGGTANGVAYLNGSKVLTTGSALTFDGTTFANIGAGDRAKFGTGARNIYIAGDTGGVSLFDGAGQTGNGWYISGASSYVAGYIGSSEQMRLTSTGLGIGTSSPAAKLDILSNVTANGVNLASSGGNIRYIVTDGTYTLRLGIQNGSAAYVGTFSNTNLQVATNGNYVATFDTSGNLGLGVTPSTSGNAYRAFEGAYASGISFDLNNPAANIVASAYNNGTNWIYKLTGYGAGRYQVASGTHTWYNAPSGTAGNAITFTQAMTLDASGNLGIGTTSPATTLHLLSTTQATERIATTSYTFDLLVNEAGNYAYLRTNTATPIVFGTNGSERARIDSSGNLLVGYTTATGVPTQGAGLNTGVNASLSLGHNGSASGTTFAYFGYNGGLIGSITQSGTTAVLYNTTSDQRLKENIVDAPEFGSVIDAIQVRSYDWKADHTHQRAGFIAQELVTVAPEAVHQPADPEEMMAVDYSKLVPMLVKEIQSLRARLKAANIA